MQGHSGDCAWILDVYVWNIVGKCLNCLIDDYFNDSLCNCFLYAVQNIGDCMFRKSPQQKMTSVVFISVREFRAGGDLGKALIELISLSFSLQDRAGTALLIA